VAGDDVELDRHTGADRPGPVSDLGAMKRVPGPVALDDRAQPDLLVEIGDLSAH
jgi:hypothetical protein